MTVRIRTRCLHAAAVSLLALCALPAFAAMQAKPVQWKVQKKTYSGFLVYDDGSTAKRPGLLMVPDWKGVTPDAVELAKDIAGDDYVVLVVDMYGKKVRPKDDAAAGALVKPLYANVQAMRDRAAGALEALKAQAPNAPLDVSRIGAFGFCFGGSSLLELARTGAELAGIVTFHGGMQTTTPATVPVKTPLLVLNGADDEGQKANILPFEKEMNQAGADWQFVNFSGAVHCFALKNANNPPGCVYDPRAAKRAYRMMEDFFEERFAQ